MTYTGGPLNELNGKMGISAPFKSVPVMKLIKVHNPKSREELVELIKLHFEKECDCGVKSTGTVETFGRNLYDSQLRYWGLLKYSLEECIQWEYDLFIVQSLKGNIIEKKAIETLNKSIPEYQFLEAQGYLDEELRIDITFRKDSNEIGGIQVKPASFKKMRSEVISYNLTANGKWDKPVFYLYYNESEEFINVEETRTNISNYLLTK